MNILHVLLNRRPTMLNANLNGMGLGGRMDNNIENDVMKIIEWG
jgi:hypothetical protein